MSWCHPLLLLDNECEFLLRELHAGNDEGTTTWGDEILVLILSDLDICGLDQGLALPRIWCSFLACDVIKNTYILNLQYTKKNLFSNEYT